MGGSNAQYQLLKTVSELMKLIRFKDPNGNTSVIAEVQICHTIHVFRSIFVLVHKTVLEELHDFSSDSKGAWRS